MPLNFFYLIIYLEPKTLAYVVPHIHLKVIRVYLSLAFDIAIPSRSSSSLRVSSSSRTSSENSEMSETFFTIKRCVPDIGFNVFNGRRVGKTFPYAIAWDTCNNRTTIAIAITNFIIKLLN